MTQSTTNQPPAMGATATGRYAPVNSLRMYYEVHGAGSGRPLVLLHGAYMSIDSAFGSLLPVLARTRQVIATEFQAHGRTADIDRSLTFEQLADDVAALLRHLDITSADVFGYSMGGAVALQLAIRHPGLAGKLVVASASYTTDGLHPDLLPLIETMTPAVMAGTPWEAEYLRLAPNPGDFATLVAKLKVLDLTPLDWPAADIQAITAPTLLIFGDADIVRLEHVVELFRLRGGVNGDLAGLPNARLAVLPATTHVGVVDQTELLLAIIPPFLDAPMT